MSSKYISGNTYATSGYTLSGVYQAITIGPSGSIGGSGLTGGSKEAYTIANLGRIGGNSYAALYLGKGGIVTNGDSGHTAALIEGGVFGIEIAGAAGTISNFGTIQPTGYHGMHGGYAPDDGVRLTDGGLITNGSATDTTALIQGNYNTPAIRVTGAAGTVVNYGTIFRLYLDAGGVITNASSGLIANAIYAQDSCTVTNAGTISDEIGLRGGGTVVNMASGTITTTYFPAIYDTSAPASVINAGIISGSGRGVDTPDGTITNTGTGKITAAGIAVVARAVTNSGTIAASGATSYGVCVINGGPVSNTVATAVIAGGARAIYVSNGLGDPYDAPGTITNAGSIIAFGTGGTGIWMYRAGGSVTNFASATISGVLQGVYFESAAGTVINAGKITGSTGDAVLLEFGGTVTNMASATLSGSGVGVQINGASGSVVNSGGIAGSAATGYGIVVTSGGGSVVNMASGTITGGKWGVQLGGVGDLALNRGTIAGGVHIGGNSATVVNYGTISGATDAVDFTNSHGTLVVEAGGKLVGAVIGDGGMLQLAGTPGTIAGIGGSFAGFGIVDLLAGANFTFTGGNTIASTGKLIADGTLIDAGIVAIDGGANLDGAIGGNGTLVLDGTISFHNAAALTVATLDLDGGTATVAAPRIYAGAFTETAGTLALDGQAFTLTGAHDALVGGTIEGPGNLYTEGTTSAASITLGGRGALRNSGTLNETGVVTLGDAAGTGALVNLAGGTFDILAAAGIAVAGSGGSIVNQGLFEKTAGGGLGSIGAAMNNAGTIAVTNGTLDFEGAVSGTGAETIGAAGTLRFDASVAATQSISFVGGGGGLVLNDPSGSGLGFAATVAGFGARDEIDLASFAYSGNPSATWSQQGNKGTLTITDGGDVARITPFRPIHARRLQAGCRRRDRHRRSPTRRHPARSSPERHVER